MQAYTYKVIKQQSILNGIFKSENTEVSSYTAVG